MTEPQKISPFEEILTDTGFQKIQRDAAYDEFMKPVWYYLIRAYALSFIWGFILVLVWVFIEKDSPVSILVFVLGSLVLAIFGGTILYIIASLLGLIPFQKYTYNQRLDFFMMIGLSISELAIIATLLIQTSSTLQRIF